jgi:hypothetical protein
MQHKKVMILSIDVGIRNLAMCMLDETSNLIVQWDVSGVPPEHKDGLFVSLRDHLDDKPWILKADTILIEKQPDKNRKMKMVEHFLHAYFIIRNPKAETIIYDARSKYPILRVRVKPCIQNVRRRLLSGVNNSYGIIQ